MINIPFFNTYIHKSAFLKAQSVLDSTFLSEGKLVKEFEKRLAKQLGLKNPITVNSGTSALHLALILAGVQESSEVICPAQTFVSTGMAILYQNAIPVFADIKYDTGNIDPEAVRKKITKKTKAIIIVHWGGYPCDIDEIFNIANEHNLIVIEDAAHALGAVYKDKPIGSISDFSCFSFQSIKHLTTGDGGAVCCKSYDISRRAIKKRWLGIDRENTLPSILGERKYNIDEIGYKYHLNDYSAALGLANLENFKERLARRKKIAEQYRTALKNISGIKLFEQEVDRESANWLFGFHVENRERFVLALKDKKVTTSVVHQGIDRNSIFVGTKDDLQNQRRFDQSQINIPIHGAITDEDVDYIVKAIKKGW